jgi:hypothetical protein
LLCPPLLGTYNGNDLAFPVQMLKAQTRNLAATKSVDRKQHQDGLIAYVSWPTAAGTTNKSLHSRPTRPNRQSFLFKHTRALNAGCYTGHTPPPDFSVAKERT